MTQYALFLLISRHHTLNFPQAQVIDFVPNNNGPIATVELTVAGYNSTPTSADDVNIVFD